MGLTDAGIPYPEPSDALGTYPTTGKAAAQATQWIQTGNLSLAGDGTSVRSQAVTFPKPFAAPGPTVLCQQTGGPTTSTVIVNLWPGSVTTTGFIANAIRSNSSPVGVLWAAIGRVVK